MIQCNRLTLAAVLAASMSLAACETTSSSSTSSVSDTGAPAKSAQASGGDVKQVAVATPATSAASASGAATTAAATASAAADPFARPGFKSELDGSILWVLKDGQKKSDKSVTYIGQGPLRTNLRALDRETAIEYLAAKPGWTVNIDENILWVLKDGQKKSDKSVTYIGQGPLRTSLRALDRETAVEYLAAKPGWTVNIDENILWVLKDGQKKSDKSVTYIGQGPLRTSLRALDRETAIEYLAAKPGFNIHVEENVVWILQPGEKKSDKSVSRIGAGPLRTHLRALDGSIIDAYLRAQ
jgi:hypothetical protein